MSTGTGGPVARAGRTVGVSALVLVLAGGAYATADAYDVVPGLVTLAPEAAPAAPFPQPPAVSEYAASHTGFASSSEHPARASARPANVTAVASRPIIPYTTVPSRARLVLLARTQRPLRRKSGAR